MMQAEKSRTEARKRMQEDRTARAIEDRQWRNTNRVEKTGLNVAFGRFGELLGENGLFSPVWVCLFLFFYSSPEWKAWGRGVVTQ